MRSKSRDLKKKKLKLVWHNMISAHFSKNMTNFTYVFIIHNLNLVVFPKG